MDAFGSQGGTSTAGLAARLERGGEARLLRGAQACLSMGEGPETTGALGTATGALTRPCGLAMARPHSEPKGGSPA